MAKLTQQERIDQLTEQMNESIENYQTDPKEEIELLRYLNKFYKYSVRNTALIQGQYKGAIGVSSYKQHQNNECQVQKGEKAIRILAPKTQKTFKDKEGNWKKLRQATNAEKIAIEKGSILLKEDLLGYISVPVFDITQTDCPEEDYPKLFPNRPENFFFNGTEKDFENFNKALKDYADEKDIIINKKSTQNVSKGYYVPSNNIIVIDNKLSETDTTKVLIHELAHAQMHNSNALKEIINDGQDVSTPVLEYQAEMTAFVIANKFGLDTEEYTQNYIANWTERDVNNDVYIQSLDKVKKVSNNMIDRINQKYQRYQTQNIFSDNNLEVKNNLTDEKLYCREVAMDSKKTYTLSTVKMLDDEGNEYQESILTTKKPNTKTLEKWKNGMTGQEWLDSDLKFVLSKNNPEVMDKLKHKLNEDNPNLKEIDDVIKDNELENEPTINR